MKNEEISVLTLLTQEDCVYYAVYLCVDELPVGVFRDLELAERFCKEFTHSWVDKEIRTVNFWKAAGPLFRDRTKHLRYFSKKDNENTNKKNGNI